MRQGGRWAGSPPRAQQQATLCCVSTPMISYPVRMVPADEGMVLVAFPDVPEAIAAGETEDEALSMAPEILEVILDQYVAEGIPLPTPSDICGAPKVATHRFSL